MQGINVYEYGDYYLVVCSTYLSAASALGMRWVSPPNKNRVLQSVGYLIARECVYRPAYRPCPARAQLRKRENEKKITSIQHILVQLHRPPSSPPSVPFLPPPPPNPHHSSSVQAITDSLLIPPPSILSMTLGRLVPRPVDEFHPGLTIQTVRPSVAASAFCPSVRPSA